MNKKLRREVMRREVFLILRRSQFEKDKEEFEGKDNYIIIEPTEEIICDSCNIEVTKPFVNLVRGLTSVACDKCFEKWYKD